MEIERLPAAASSVSAPVPAPVEQKIDVTPPEPEVEQEDAEEKKESEPGPETEKEDEDEKGQRKDSVPPDVVMSAQDRKQEQPAESPVAKPEEKKPPEIPASVSESKPEEEQPTEGRKTRQKSKPAKAKAKASHAKKKKEKRIGKRVHPEPALPTVPAADPTSEERPTVQTPAPVLVPELPAAAMETEEPVPVRETVRLRLGPQSTAEKSATGKGHSTSPKSASVVVIPQTKSASKEKVEPQMQVVQATKPVNELERKQVARAKDKNMLDDAGTTEAQSTGDAR